MAGKKNYAPPSDHAPATNTGAKEDYMNDPSSYGMGPANLVSPLYRDPVAKSSLGAQAVGGPGNKQRGGAGAVGSIPDPIGLLPDRKKKAS